MKKISIGLQDDLNNAFTLNKFCKCLDVNDAVEQVEDHNTGTIFCSILDEHALKMIRIKVGKQKRICWWDGTCHEVQRWRQRAERAYRYMITRSSDAHRVFKKHVLKRKECTFHRPDRGKHTTHLSYNSTSVIPGIWYL